VALVFDECYKIVCHMMTQSKVTVTQVRNLQKWPILESNSCANMHVIKKNTNGEF